MDSLQVIEINFTEFEVPISLSIETENVEFCCPECEHVPMQGMYMVQLRIGRKLFYLGTLADTVCDDCNISITTPFMFLIDNDAYITLCGVRYTIERFCETVEEIFESIPLVHYVDGELERVSL